MYEITQKSQITISIQGVRVKNINIDILKGKFFSQTVLDFYVGT